MTAGFFSFFREPDWWPDKEMLHENTMLKEEVLSLKNNNSSVFRERDSLKTELSKLKSQLKSIMDGKSATEQGQLQQINSLADSIKILTASLTKEKKAPDHLNQSLKGREAAIADISSALAAKTRDCKPITD